LKKVIEFLKYRYIAFALSGILFLSFITVTIINGGLNFGIDFIGGSKIIAKFDSNVNEEKIRDILKKYNPTVQKIGDDSNNKEKTNFIITTKLVKIETYEKIQEKLESKIKNLEFKHHEKIGNYKYFNIVIDLGVSDQKEKLLTLLSDYKPIIYVNTKNDNTYRLLLNRKFYMDKNNSVDADIKKLIRKEYKKLIYQNNDILIPVSFEKIVLESKEKLGQTNINLLLKEYNPVLTKTKIDNEYSLKISYLSVNKRLESVKSILENKFKSVEFLSSEDVGPAIGDFLRKSAISLFAWAMIFMAVYLAFRFELKYSFGALAALVHDITLSVVFCGFAGVEINIPVIAALLTIFGYSINDTIVIFDRIRENASHTASKLTYLDVINKSITQSISRTLLTSLTTLFAVLSLYFLGGKVLNDFAVVLLFGIFVGTYSSVYVAAPVLIYAEKFLEKK
jgi:preprotein translocase subunit SecF